MTQPKFAPILENVEVREVLALPTPPAWEPHRPADFRADPTSARPPNTGIPGPDQGYALRLADRLKPKLRLADDEHADDVLTGAVAIGLRRAALFGRAPVTADLELALHLFGFLEGAPEDVVESRQRYFSGASHNYWQQRDLAEWVPESTLRLRPSDLRAILADEPESWRDLAGVPEE